jgi:hypothetical protein
VGSTAADNAGEMAVVALLDDDALRADGGANPWLRRYADRMFEICQIADRFERLFERLTTGTP